MEICRLDDIFGGESVWKGSRPAIAVSLEKKESLQHTKINNLFPHQRKQKHNQSALKRLMLRCRPFFHARKISETSTCVEAKTGEHQGEPSGCVCSALSSPKRNFAPPAHSHFDAHADQAGSRLLLAHSLMRALIELLLQGAFAPSTARIAAMCTLMAMERRRVAALLA